MFCGEIIELGLLKRRCMGHERATTVADLARSNSLAFPPENERPVNRTSLVPFFVRTFLKTRSAATLWNPLPTEQPPDPQPWRRNRTDPGARQKPRENDRRGL